MTDLFVNDNKQQLALNLLLVFVYLSLNCVLNLTNKWVLGVYGFSFPLLLTASHMIFSFVALFPVMLCEPYKSKHAATLQTQWKGLLAIGVYMAANISLNNMSLVLITLSLNQVIRSAIPVCTAVLAVFIEQYTPSREEATSLAVLTCGVMIAVWEVSMSGSVPGLLLCCAGTVCNAAMMCTTGKIMSEKLDVLRLTFYIAPVSCALLLPLFCIREGARFTLYWTENSTGVMLVLVCSSTVALLYNLVHSLMIHKTSAVTTTVLGEVKIIGLLVLSALLLGEKKAFTPKLTAGVTISVLGFCWYGHSKLKRHTDTVVVPATSASKIHKTNAAQEPLLPVSPSESS